MKVIYEIYLHYNENENKRWTLTKVIAVEYTIKKRLFMGFWGKNEV